jgi:hypothetical protein
MASDAFQHVFNAWLDRVLAEPVPEIVIAFSFNLAEPWCIELVGFDWFSDDDPDWGCPPEAFRPAVGDLDLPEEEVGEDWQSVLEAAKSMVSAYLDRPSPGRDRLRKAVAVAIGFVDGELHKFWPRG